MFFTHLHSLNSSSLEYWDKVNVSLDALNLVRKFRNTIAHNLNFLTYRGSSLNKKANLLFKDTLVSKKEIPKTRNDIWAMVMSIVILLNNKYLIQNFLAEFQSFMKFNDELAETYCEVSGIPLNFEDRINNFLDILSLETSEVKSSIDEVAVTKQIKEWFCENKKEGGAIS